MNLDARIQLARQAQKSQQSLILLVAEDQSTAQFRYRCLNVAEATAKSSRYTVVWFLKSELAAVEQLLPQASLLVIERQTGKDGLIGGLITKAHAAGIKALFDLDDLIFDYRDIPVLMWSTNSRNVAYWAGYFWGIRRIARKADGFICTNEFLAGKLKRSFKKSVAVIPNSLNKEQIDASAKWIKKLKKLDKVEKSVREDKKFTIGYFSGSPTHAKDFRLVEPELVRFLDSHKNATLKIVGDMKYSKSIQGLIEKKRVETAKKIDYLRLQGRIAKVDVSIAPLVVNDFTNCKSELKFFEAAAAETTTIASPSYAFKEAITDGENGFLAEPGEWYSKLEYLYAHPEENQKIARTAKKYALAHYAGPAFLKSIEEAYDYFTK